MSILAALVRRYDHMTESGSAPSPGYSEENISFAVILSEDGDVVDIEPLGSPAPARGKKSGRQGDWTPSARMLVPRAAKRSSNVVANLMWDKTAYVFGCTKAAWEARERARKAREACREDEEREALAEAEDEDGKAAIRNAAFRKRQREAIPQGVSPQLDAFLRFCDKWQPGSYPDLPHAKAMLDTQVVFRLDGPGEANLHDTTEARTIIQSLEGGPETTSPEDGPICLVTGRSAPAARLHMGIKNVAGGQSSGAALVTFNARSTESFGKSQGDNAPVSEEAAKAYGIALNALLADPRHSVRIGETTTVFWIEGGSGKGVEEAEDMFSRTLGGRPGDDLDAVRVHASLRALADGRLAEDSISPELPVKVLGLTPNGGRISVRFWLEESLGTLSARLYDHCQALELAPRPYRRMPSVSYLVSQLAPYRRRPDGRAELDRDKVPMHLAGELTRAILFGTRYPASILPSLLMRMRADGEVNGLRTALVKAVLTRMGKEVPVAIDVENRNPGYVLGRLFAVIEYAQREALGKKVGTTVRDKFMASASTTPGRIFPVIIRNAQNHVSKIRKTSKGGGARVDRMMGEIISSLDDERPFPGVLDAEDQGRFIVGYYHQRNAIYTKRENGTEDQDDAIDAAEDEAKE